MKRIIILTRISSKEAFKKLRELWEIECKDLWKNFKITNLFFRHISWQAKSRSVREVIERLTSINLIEKIASEWKLIETRKDIIVEWKKNFVISYKMKLQIWNIEFFIILWEKINNEIVLISVFLNFLK